VSSHFLLNLSHQVVMLVKELRVFVDFTGAFVKCFEFVFINAKILDQRLVFVIVYFEHDFGVCQFRQLDCLLEKANPSFLESDSPDSIVVDFLDLDLLATHMFNILLSKV